MGKQQDDRDDVAVIAEALIRFGAMTFEEYVKHIEQHPEDKLHHLNLPPGRGHRLLNAEASGAFARLAKRQRSIDPDKHAIDQAELDLAIRDMFVDIFITNGKPWDEQKWIDRMLSRALKNVKRKHEPITHYLPCVFLYRAHPPEFAIGPVRFISTVKFFDDYRAKIEHDHRAAEDRRKKRLEELIAQGKYQTGQRPSEEEAARLSKLELDWVTEYYGGFQWVIEVSVPACDPKVSRLRAETTAQAALDVLKLFFGPHHGKDFRLGHERGRPDKTAHLTHDHNGDFHFSWGRGGEGGYAEDGGRASLRAALRCANRLVSFRRDVRPPACEESEMAGTLKHSYAAKLIDRYQRLYGAVGEGLTTEQSYAAGEYLGRAQNIKGSVRLDVVEHVVENPTAIFDFKFTINPNPILSPARVLQIRRAAALAEDVPLETVHP